MLNLFDAGAAKSLSDRLDLLTDQSVPMWGAMTVDQMLWHCNQFMAYAKSDIAVRNRSSWIMRVIFKPLGLGKMPFPKGKADTIPEFKVKERYDIDTERQKLKDYINWLSQSQGQKSWPPHPFFGAFTADNWARMAYKHTDHHLRQFGV